ncbi:MAG: DEAD/DEAH box helicase [Planctomycetota bacterium]
MPPRNRSPQKGKPRKSTPRPKEETVDAGPLTDAPTGPGVETFAELDLSPTMHAALEKVGYEKPSPVQAGVIPFALKGRDVLGQARTGTGKTASFAIPILETLTEAKRGAPPQAIILLPTRELAVQVRDEIGRLSHGRDTRCVAVYGGKPIKGQIAKLERGAHIVVGTPGRVLDHISRGTLDLRGLRCVVLDEADRMLDIGFRPDIEKILRQCPKDRQTLLLSATVAPGVRRLAERYMRNPEVLDFSPKTKSVDTIEQFYFTVDQPKKFDLLLKLIEREDPAQTIIFCRTKRGTDKIQQRLGRKIKGVDCIHGDMPQGARDRVMKKFRAGDVKTLVATDVVGRGIDVSSISHIINYDIPESSDDYVHRVGRTGRMGREGVAYTFVTTEQGSELTRIEMLINKELKRDEIEGFDATMSVTGGQPAPQRTVQFFGMGSPAPSSNGASDSAPPAADEAPAETAPKKTPPGQRPRKRHRRGL